MALGYSNVGFLEVIFLLTAIVLAVVKTNVAEALFIPLYSTQKFMFFAIFVRCGLHKFAKNTPDNIVTSLISNFYMNALKNLPRFVFYPLIF